MKKVTRFPHRKMIKLLLLNIDILFLLRAKTRRRVTAATTFSRQNDACSRACSRIRSLFFSDVFIGNGVVGSYVLAWISSDYFESLLLPRLRRKRLDAIGWISGYLRSPLTSVYIVCFTVSGLSYLRSWCVVKLWIPISNFPIRF